MRADNYNCFVRRNFLCIWIGHFAKDKIPEKCWLHANKFLFWLCILFLSVGSVSGTHEVVGVLEAGGVGSTHHRWIALSERIQSHLTILNSPAHKIYIFYRHVFATSSGDEIQYAVNIR